MAQTVQLTDDETATTSGNAETSRQSPYTMTEEILQKRIEHENKGRYITQLCPAIVVFLASLAALAFGTALGWSNPAIHHTKHLYNLTISDYGLVTSLMPLGCSVGIMPWTYAIKYLGPKHTLLLQAPCCIIFFLIILTVKNWEIYLASRFISGFLSISNLMGGERLLIDSVHPGYVRRMIVFFRTSLWLGVSVAYLVRYFSSKFWLGIVCTAIPIINSMIVFFLPESPVFLFNKSEVKAGKSLSWYRGHTNIYTELQFIKKDAEVRKMIESEKYILRSKVVIKGILIVLGLTFFQVFSGHYAFVVYTLMLWRVENDRYNSFRDSIIFGVCLCLSNFIGSMVHYGVPFGVRKPLLVSTTLTAISLTILSVYMFFHEKDDMVLARNYHWVPLTIVSSCVVSYETGLGTYADILLFDYLPYQIYRKAKSLKEIYFWLLIFLLTKYIISIRYNLSACIAFGILALIIYIGIIYCYVFIVETKGKNLIQIQIEIGGNPIGNRAGYRNRYGTILVPRHYDAEPVIQI